MELSGKQYVTLLRRHEFSAVTFVLPFIISLLYCCQGDGGYVIMTQEPCGDYKPTAGSKYMMTYTKQTPGL
jgi:hypothetical protein